MASSYDRRIKIENAANSAVVLTKEGQKYANASVDVLEKLISNPDKSNYNALIGAAVNPNLPSELIRPIFAKLNKEVESDKADTSLPKSTKTKNVGLREKIRRLLTQHPNLDAAAKKAILLNKKAKTENILANPSLTDDDLQLFFDNKVLDGKNSYSFLAFGKLMTAKQLNTKLLFTWFVQLKPFCDWTYSDNQWYSVVNDYLESELCPIEVLIAVASAPKDGKDSWRSNSERYREEAVNHKNADDNIKALAYEATDNEKYLPQIAKDVFLF
jgi:hypothetical protein